MVKETETLSQFDMKKNSLNTIRLLAAISVMFGHACTHLSVERPIILSQVLEFFFGVPIFFAMSGYLIWNSVGKSKDFLSYAKKRFWRIYPELWVGVAVEIVSIILFYEGSIQWGKLGLFTVTQGTFLQFWTPDFLRAYGCGTPNGSLWTICVLIQFYILAYPMEKLLRGKKTGIWMGAIVVSLVVAAVSPLLENVLPEIMYKLYNQTIVPYLWLFLIGEFVAENQTKLIPWLKKWWLPLFALSVAVMAMGIDVMGGPHRYGILRCTTLIAAVLGFAYRFPQLNVKTDISYGIYIYHMIVVNVMIAVGATGTLPHVFGAMAISCVVAYLSTKTVGRLHLEKRKAS